MAHYDDLQPCGYFRDALPVNVLAIGWLEKGHAFRTGDPGQAFHSKLKRLAHLPWVHPRAVFFGGHHCDLCQYDRFYSVFNLFIPGDGVIYVAPEAIGHYVAAHGYCPPEEFCRAVMDCPSMTSPAYFEALLRCGWSDDSTKANSDASQIREGSLLRSLRWAVGHTVLAQAAMYEHAHGCLPQRMDQLSDLLGACGLNYRIVDQRNRISYQETTLGEVVQLYPTLDWEFASQSWEWFDGEWRRHEGFTESATDDDRKWVEMMRAQFDGVERPSVESPQSTPPLFYPVWPK